MMSSNQKKDSPASYSADYRDSFSAQEKKEKPRPRQQKKTKRTSPAKRKPVPEAASSAQSKAPAEPAAKRKPVSQPSSKHRERLENDVEIDDFLPDEDTLDEERLLTKWDDGLNSEVPGKEMPRRRGRNRYGIFVGSLVLLFALVGVGFLATTIGTKIHARLTDDTRERQYDQLLTVVVAQDPEPFHSPSEADTDFVLNASLWQTMLSDSAANYTDYDDVGKTIVPLGDVADACHQLFGPDCQLQPKNPTEETFYDYDSQNAQFHVALYSLDSTYTPYTENIKKKGNTTVLRVGYVPPSDETRAQSGQVSSDVTPKPIKYMEYDLKTDPSTQKEYIYALKALPDS